MIDLYDTKEFFMAMTAISVLYGLTVRFCSGGHLRVLIKAKTHTHGSPMSWHVLVATFDLSAAHTTTVHIFPVTCRRPHLICQQHTHTYAHTHMYIMQDYRRNIHAKLVFKETSRFKEPDALKNTCDT